MPVLDISQRLKRGSDQWRAAAKQLSCSLRCGLPGIIQSFDATECVAQVQLAVRERVIVDGALVLLDLPVLPDVLVMMPHAGQFALTLPVQAGDECFVHFADACIDAWWQSSQVSDPLSSRRHSLSDGFATLGPWSTGKVLQNYSAASMQLRSLDGTVVIDIAASAVTITAPTVNVNAQNATVSASQAAQVAGQTVSVHGANSVAILGAGNTTIEGRNFLTHTHAGVSAGGGVSGPVV